MTPTPAVLGPCDHSTATAEVGNSVTVPTLPLTRRAPDSRHGRTFPLRLTQLRGTFPRKRRRLRRPGCGLLADDRSATDPDIHPEGADA